MKINIKRTQRTTCTCKNAKRRTSESLVIIQRTGGGVRRRRRHRRGGEKPAVGQPSASRAPASERRTQSEFYRRRHQVLRPPSWLRDTRGDSAGLHSLWFIVTKCGRGASDVFCSSLNHQRNGSIVQRCSCFMRKPRKHVEVINSQEIFLADLLLIIDVVLLDCFFFIEN